MSADGGRRTHVAFLRAVNIGGRRVRMEALRAALDPLGLDHVATWQATGNIAFATDPEAEPAELEPRLAAALAEGLGMEVPTIVRTAQQVRAVASGVPFPADRVAVTEGRVQVLFVRDEPDPDVVARVLAEHATPRDELHWQGRELWWLPRRGVSDSDLRVSVVERSLGTATMRTHRAVAGLAARLLTD